MTKATLSGKQPRNNPRIPLSNYLSPYREHAMSVGVSALQKGKMPLCPMGEWCFDRISNPEQSLQILAMTGTRSYNLLDSLTRDGARLFDSVHWRPLFRKVDRADRVDDSRWSMMEETYSLSLCLSLSLSLSLSRIKTNFD